MGNRVEVRPRTDAVRCRSSAEVFGGQGSEQCINKDGRQCLLGLFGIMAEAMGSTFAPHGSVIAVHRPSVPGLGQQEKPFCSPLFGACPGRETSQPCVSCVSRSPKHCQRENGGVQQELRSRSGCRQARAATPRLLYICSCGYLGAASLPSSYLSRSMFCKK